MYWIQQHRQHPQQTTHILFCIMYNALTFWMPHLFYFKSKSKNHRMSRIGKDLCGSSDTTFLLKQGHLKAQDCDQMILESFSSIILLARKTLPPLWAACFTMLSRTLQCIKCIWPWYPQPADVQAQFCTLHLGKVLLSFSSLGL